MFHEGRLLFAALLFSVSEAGFTTYTLLSQNDMLYTKIIEHISHSIAVLFCRTFGLELWLTPD